MSIKTQKLAKSTVDEMMSSLDVKLCHKKARRLTWTVYVLFTMLTDNDIY